MSDARVILKPRRAGPSFGRHPWVFTGAVAKIEGEPAPGESVAVQSDRGEFIAYGLLSRKSSLAVRLYSWDIDRPICEELLAERLQAAIRMRQELGLADPRGACRLVFSEGDGLSGLIVDRWGDVVVLQIGSAALLPHEPLFVRILQETLAPRAIYRSVDPGMGANEGIEVADELLAGAAVTEPIAIVESGVKMLIDPVGGQKTGAYLDQRENRKRVAEYARGKSILDLFSYTGGFGLVAARLAGAGPVTAVDSSAAALALAEENARRNGIELTTRQGDAAAVLTEWANEGRSFGVVVCDPPKFAPKRADVEGALAGYQYINRRALAMVEPGGILATFSCSGHVTPTMFWEMLAEAARRAGRDVQVLESLGQAPDHPVSIFCPESAYLCGLIARVT